MQYKILKFSYLIVFLVFAHSLKSQVDPQFTQFYANSLLLGPSFAGTTEGTRFGLNYRSQWARLNNSFNTYSFSVDHSVPEIQSGFGLIILKDKSGAGGMGLLNISPMYSYEFELKNGWFCRPGLTFSFVQKTLVFSDLTFRDQMFLTRTEPTSIEISPTEKVFHIDFSSSVLVFSQLYWGGLTVDHLMTPLQPTNSIQVNIPMKFSLYGGAKKMLSTNFQKDKEKSISGAFLIRTQSYLTQLDIGAYGTFTPILIGIWYRGIPIVGETRDALSFLIGMKMDDYSIGYSYDLTISKLKTATGGSHEISLIYKMNQYKKLARGKIQRIAIPCPIF